MKGLLPYSLGLRLIPSEHMVRLVQYRRPVFRYYPVPRWLPLYRALRCRFVRWRRRVWAADPKNWRTVPLTSIIKTPDGHIIAHPTLIHKIQTLLPPPDYGAMA